MRKIERKFWIAENEGDTIEGTIIVTGGTVETDFGPMETITLKAPDGEKYRVGLATSLLGLMSEVKLGDYIKIVYLGEKVNPKNKRRFKAYDLYVSEDDEEELPFNHIIPIGIQD